MAQRLGTLVSKRGVPRRKIWGRSRVYARRMGVEEMAMTKSKLEWKKTRVADSIRRQMVTAVERLNETTNERFQLITHLFGKQFVCRIAEITIFTAGTSTRPSNIIPIAISAESPDWVCIPMTNPNDLSELCDRLGFEDETSRQELIEFLTPRSKKSSSSQ